MNVIVCGCARSGTSYVTGAIAKAGWDIGTRAKTYNVSIKDRTNEERNEDPDFIRGNLNVFQADDGHGIAPPYVCTKTVKTPRDVLDDKRGPWILKDPAAALTLPAWCGIIDKNVLVVGCVRHPVAVARSMNKGFGITVRRGLDLWFHHLSSLLTWEAVMGLNLRFVHFPSKDGMLKVFEILGADPDRGNGNFDASMVHFDEEDGAPDALMDLYRHLRERAKKWR
jgi:hypothetical protein